MTTDFDLVSSEDLKAARLLIGIHVKTLAAAVGVSAPAISRLENEGLKRSETRFLVVTFMARYGVNFVEPGIITHPRLGRAPTPAAVGHLSGARLRRAREALDLTRWQATLLCGGQMTSANLIHVEKLADPLDDAQARHAVTQFNAYEKAGFRFARDARQDRRMPA